MRDFISGVTQGLCLGGMVKVLLEATRSSDEIISENRDASRLSMSDELVD